MKNTLIIAEAGVNHNGSIDMAFQLIDAAYEAGADVVKFQTFKADKLVGKSASKADYQKKTTDQDESQYEMIKKLELSEEEHHQLAAYCKRTGIEFMSTPFDIDSVDLLVNRIGVNKLKIPSGEITNAQLLLHCASTGRPIIMSTGMSTLSDIESALSVLAFGFLYQTSKKPHLKAFREAYNSELGQALLKEKVTLLHCTTEYPAPFNEVNLRAMDTLKSAFGLQVGFSDHTVGISVPIAAAALGAIVIEKHFTLDQTLPGPDHKASLEPSDLKNMVKSIREVDLALGLQLKTVSSSEIKNIDIVRKSLVVSTEIKKGELFTENNLTVKRPGNGVSPMYYWDYIGKKADKDYDIDEIVSI